MQAPEWRKWKIDPPSAIPTTSPTLSNQSSLPSLPVPSLDSTLSKLLASCEPFFASPDQKSSLERKLKNFKEGLGSDLQKRLVDHAATQEDIGNWIAEWWDQLAYMTFRGPVVIHVSYYYGFSRLPQSPEKGSATAKADPAYVAASIAASALDFRQSLIEGKLPADKIGGQPVCMESYKWAFNACRIPSVPGDHAVKIREDSPEGQHVTVIRQNRVYEVPCPDPSLPFPVRVQAFRSAFQKVREEADAAGPAEPVGVLTASDRDPWAEAREELVKDEGNRKALRSVETSAFAVCFDDVEPDVQSVEWHERAWHARAGQDGRAGNRWWDKPMNYVVTDNGLSAVVGEHSCMDGTPTAALNDWLTHRLLGTGGVAQPPAASASDPPPPALTATSLPFTVTPPVLSAIEKATSTHAKAVEDNRLAYRMYRRYGKETIKKHKCSPDGWAQMVIQLAWAITMGRDKAPCGTYESAQVRRFKLGRTEVVRTVTKASADWVEWMLTSSTRDSPAEKKRLFQAAVAAHGAYMKDASSAQAIDRHWLGLKLCLKEGEAAPEVFSDEVVLRAGKWNLSTSQIYIEAAEQYGWGAVVEDGFGIPYMIRPHALQFTVTGRKEMPVDAMADNLCKAADMVLEFHEAAAEVEGRKAKL